MPQNYFDDGEDQSKPAMADKPEGDEKGEKSDQPTFLINSEVCPDMKPGDMMDLRIVAVHDGEYEVAYEEKGKEESSEEQPQGESDSMGGEAQVPDSMMD